MQRVPATTSTLAADPIPQRCAEELAAIGLLESVKDFFLDDWTTRGMPKAE